MSTMTRDERLSRQDRDDGDGEDTVYVIQSGTMRDDRISTVNTYHDTEECPHFNRRKRDPREMSRKGAQLRWLGPCKICVLKEAKWQ